MNSPLFEKLLNTELNDSSKDELWQEFGLERATVVIDSSGFSRVTQEKGILHILHLIGRMRSVFEVCFGEFGASRFRFEADNSYAEFESVDAAFKAALACNTALADKGLMLLEDEPFTVCIGIGFGHLLDAGHEGVYGDEMNRVCPNRKERQAALS